MPTLNDNLPSAKTPTLVIDSSVIRKHLFKGWPVLNRIAVIARSGRINLCIPWLVEQEVLSGIEKHVDELTGQETFLSNVRLIAPLSSNPETVRALCDNFEKLRPTICKEARSRFQHWLETSQADRLPLKHEHTEKVFKAYFAGDLPFDKPKNREHLPDAFIFNAVVDLVNQGCEVWFLAADGQLRESLRKTKGVRVYRVFQSLFEDLQIPFDYEQQQALSLILPDTEALCESARISLRSELCGQALRYGVSEHSITPRIHEVQQVRNLSVDRQSIMHVDGSTLLIAFEADVVVQAVQRIINNRDLTERLSEFAISIRGHFLVAIDRTENAEQKITGVEVDDFEIGAMEESVGGQILQSIPPQPKVDSYYEDNIKNFIQNEDGGLIVVVGSTLRNRRLVAEHLIAARKKYASFLGFLPFLPKTKIEFQDCDNDDHKSLMLLLKKVEDGELDALGLSCEDADWMTVKMLDSLRESNCFIVATMKSLNNRSAVVRHLTKITGGTTDLKYLSAIAWIQKVTAETITFAICEHSEWGDGSWEAVLRRDESLQGKSNA